MASNYERHINAWQAEVLRQVNCTEFFFFTHPRITNLLMPKTIVIRMKNADFLPIAFQEPFGGMKKIS